MEFDLKVFEAPTVQFNYEEIKAEVRNRANELLTKEYTAESIKEVKSDRANINKFTKTLNNKRIALQKEYLKPFNQFKEQIDEIIEIAEEPRDKIDACIKEQEEINKPKLKVDTSKWYTFDLLLDEKKLIAFEKFLSKNEIECVTVTKTLVLDSSEVVLASAEKECADNEGV